MIPSTLVLSGQFSRFVCLHHKISVVVFSGFFFFLVLEMQFCYNDKSVSSYQFLSNFLTNSEMGQITTWIMKLERIKVYNIVSENLTERKHRSILTERIKKQRRKKKKRIISWFYRYVNLSRVISCLEVRELRPLQVHIYLFLCYCFLRLCLFCTWFYQIPMIFKQVCFTHSWAIKRSFHFGSKSTWK